MAKQSASPLVKSPVPVVKSPAPAVKSPALAVQSLAPAVQSLALHSYYSTILVPTTARIQFLTATTGVKNYYNLVLATNHTVAEGIAYYTN